MADQAPVLPIDDILPALSRALEGSTAAILIAEPGAGKTTRVPPALARAAWAKDGKVIVLSPRRVAARAAAARMAAESGQPLGGFIGYRVRLDAKVSKATRVEVVTEGVFTRMALSDPELSGVAAVIFDEFHERSLEGDLGLALALDIQQALRPDLRILIMSATLNAEAIAKLLGGAPVLRCPGRTFPIDVRYRPQAARARLEEEMTSAVELALAQDDGGVLAFLPGAREIERTASLLRERVKHRGADVLLLYGALSPADQDAAIAPSTAGRRKIVLATDIAETSLTIQDVRIVVDAGLARRACYEPGLGLSRLQTVRASKASIEQRKGRAGRVAPGVCWRLWHEGETAALRDFDPPEILEADLSSVALVLANWGVADPRALTWADLPPEPAWKEAQSMLHNIGALENGRLTAHGKAIADLPASPRLAHMIIGGRSEGRGLLAAYAAMLLSEQGLGGRDADLALRLLNLIQDRSKRANAARAMALRMSGENGRTEVLDEDALGVVLARAFPDRVAKARQPGQYTMANGRAASIDVADPLAKAQFLVIADAAGAADRTRILAAAPIELRDIEQVLADRIKNDIEITFDRASGRIRASRARKLGAIALSQGQLEEVSEDQRAQAWRAAVEKHGLSIFDLEPAAPLRARVAFMNKLEPAAWPDWSEQALCATLEDWLAPYLRTARKASDIDIASALHNALDYTLQARLKREAPTNFETPAGASHRIEYVGENAPALDVRVQELFGLSTHPTIPAGSTPLTLRLLSPAQRPIQTTKDLPGFWRGSYASVRADMRGRYPKHPWPEDPMTAPPTRRAKPKGT